MKILFRNAQILSFEKNALVRGSLAVENGVIAEIGEIIDDNSFDRVIDCNSNILMPGFVNAHCHTPMTILRSINDEAELNEWLFDYVLPAEDKLLPQDVYWGQYLGILESVRAGITAFEEGYFHNSIISDVFDKSGIRGRIGIGPALVDRGMSNSDYLNMCAGEINNNDRVKTSCFIHSIYTTSEKAIVESINFAKSRNIDMSIHLAETEKEVLDCKAQHSCTPTEYLDGLGMFDTNCLCYHSVHMTDNDMNILKSKSVSVATCPSSNLKLGSGVAPIMRMYKKGINICIGTDGVASNNSLDMFKEMFLVANLNKVSNKSSMAIPSIEILKMATLNGAKALNLNSGDIRVGADADIILIDIHQPHYYPHSNLLSHLVYSGKSSDVSLTMVGGKIVYDNGKYNVGEDIEKIYENVNNIRQRLVR